MKNKALLTKLREKKGLTRAELAETSGVNLRMIQKYENGEKDLSKAAYVTVYALASALEVNTEDLFDVNELMYSGDN